MGIELYFSQHYGVDPAVLDDYGTIDISLVSDLPLFVDPFLLFHSEKAEYQQLHEDILQYLRFLRDQAARGLDPAQIANWYRFKEVKQNWFGYTFFGNGGSGLGSKFAGSLHEALGSILSDFGAETITHGSHLEKLCLIQPGVGKDNISDFTTNLIKGFLCEYTQAFANEHLAAEHCDTFAVTRAVFNYDTHAWATKSYYLPRLGDDFVLLTPKDMLTKDETWINYSDMTSNFHRLPESIPDGQLRAQVNEYLAKALGEDPTPVQIKRAIADTIRRFPDLIDRYIRLKEDTGDRATSVSADKVEAVRRALIEEIQAAVTELAASTEFFKKPWTTYEECLARVHYFKDYVENNDGYRLFNPGGRPFSNEQELHLAFGLVWGGTDLDINREVNNGRGPVDFKVSYGAGDKSLIEFKLAKNTQLKRNLEKQVAIYEAANKTRKSVKVIVFYTDSEQKRVEKILKELKLSGEESVVLIDARRDNKPSASKA